MAGTGCLCHGSPAEPQRSCTVQDQTGGHSQLCWGSSRQKQAFWRGDRFAGLCLVAVPQEREQKACEVSRFSLKNGQTRFTPRDEDTPPERDSRDRILGLQGFAQLPRVCKPACQQQADPEALHTPQSPATQHGSPQHTGRHQNRDSPAGGLGAASPAAAGAAQAVPAMGSGSQHLSGVCLLTAGCGSPKRWARNHTNQQGRGTQEQNGNLQGLCVQRNGPSQGEQRRHSALC